MSESDFINAMLTTYFEKKGYAELKQIDFSLTGGATYSVNGLEGFNSTIWLCPVTLFVLAQYPKFLYVRKHKDNRISTTETEETKTIDK